MYMIFFNLARLYLYTFYANYKKILKQSRGLKTHGKRGKPSFIQGSRFFKENLWQKKKSFLVFCIKKNTYRFCYFSAAQRRLFPWRPIIFCRLCLSGYRICYINYFIYKANGMHFSTGFVSALPLAPFQWHGLAML